LNAAVVASSKVSSMPESTALSQKELLALALEAAQREDRGHCMMYLKEAAARWDASAEACFMLGSEYAQLQLMDDARALMHKSLDIEPGFGIARFQLGLLYLTQNLPAEAQAVWAPLAELDDDDPLVAFHKGLLHLIQDEFADAVRWLERGLALNTANPALSRDMQMLIDQVRQLQVTQAGNEPASTPDPARTSDEDANHLFLNAYQRKVH
jgi:tetratricopeptide (TPR) repeat protein